MNAASFRTLRALGLFFILGIAGLAPSIRAETVCLSSTCFTCRGQAETYTAPAGTTCITVKIWGAGAGYTGSASGGNGDYVCATYNVQPGQACTVRCGSGGAGTGSGCSGECTQVDTPCGTIKCAGGGSGGGCSGATGSYCNLTMQAGTNTATAPNCSDPEYPRDGSGCHGTCDHTSGWSGCVIIDAFQNQQSQTITFPNPGNQIVGASVVLPATASSGLPVGYALTTGPATLSGSTVTTNGVGSVTITASQAGSNGFVAAPPVSVTFQVCNRTSITSSTSGSGKVNIPFTYQTTATGSPTGYTASGLPPGLSIDPVTGLVSGTPTTAGTYPVTITATNPASSSTATVTIRIAQTYQLAISGSPAGAGNTSGAGIYDPGTVVTISETPASRYRAAGWGGPDGSKTASQSSATTTIVMNGDRNLTALFVQQAILTVTFGKGGSAIGSGVYDVGTAVSIVATPNAHYVFNSWSGPSVASPSSATTTVTLTGDEMVAAYFTQMCVLTITGSPAGGGTMAGAGTYPAGTVVTVTETAGTGYRAGGWGGNDAGSLASPTSATSTITMDSDKSLTANFVQQVSLTVTAGTGGTATGGGVYDIGSVVPVTETASAGYRTGGWTGPDAASLASPASASTTITLTANKAIATVFVRQVSLTVTAGTGGTATGGGTYDIGATVPIAETAAAGYRAGGWGGPNVANVASPSSATTTILMSGNETVAASFVRQVTLTVVAAAGGTATGGGTYDIGTTVPVSETAANGYRTAGWSGMDAGSLASRSSPATTIVMTSNKTVTPVFVQQATLTVVAGAGGTATGSGTYDVGTVVPVSAAPSGSNAFLGWTGPGLANPGAAATTVTLASSETVTAAFTARCTLSIAGSPASGGTVTGAGSYPIGTVVTVTETGASGYRAAGWSGTDAGSLASASSPSTTITMNSNRSLTANFVQQATLTLVGGAGGTVTGAGTYDVGTVVAISEAANGGYRAAGWGGPNVANVASPSSAATTILMSGNETVAASFVRQATLTVAAAAGGTATGGGTYDVGTTVPVSEAAANGYRAAGWSGTDAGSLASQSSPATTIVMTSNKSIAPVFVQQATLTVLAGLGGTATGSGTYDVGTVVSITATPAGGDAFSGWTGPGVANPGAAATTVTLASSETVTAAFTAMYTLSIAASPSSGGTATGAGTYPAGTVVTVAETGASGYRTAGWSGPDAVSLASASSPSTTITMNSNKSLTANFVQQATLTLVGGAGGTVTGAGTYDVGTVVAISEVPNGGYRAAGWSGPDVASVTSPSSPSTTIVMSSDKSLAASFVKQATLTLTAAGGGTAAGAGTYDIGTLVPISEAALAGYRAAGWTGPDVASVVAPTSAATSIVMDADKTITPEFVQQVTLTVTSGPGGTATGGGIYDVGTTVPIAAYPSAGYQFGGWTGAAPASATASPTTIVMTSDASISASFAPEPPTVSLNSGATAYTGSPFHVSSAAAAPAADLTLHSIEWLAPSGDWTVNAAPASGSASDRTLGISFPAPGVYTIRAGASIDNGTTWVYSASVQVTVSDGITSYTLATMAVPDAGVSTWYAASPVVQRVYQVKHLNP